MRLRRVVLGAIAVVSFSAATVVIRYAVRAWQSAVARAPASWEKLGVSPVHCGDWITFRKSRSATCMATHDGKAWIGTAEGEVLCYDLSSGAREWFPAFPGGEGENVTIMAVEVDAEGVVWACSEGKQVRRLMGRSFEPMGNLFSVAARYGVFTVTDKGGNKWLTVGLDQAMVCKDGQWQLFQDAYPEVWRNCEVGWKDPPSGTVGPDAEGCIWLRGVFVELAGDGERDVGWLGCFDGQRWHIHADRSVWRGMINKLFVDHKGRIWVVERYVIRFFDGEKLCEFVTITQAWEQFESAEEQGGFTFLALDGRGRAWMVVKDSGGDLDRLLAFDGHRFWLYDERQGLAKYPKHIVGLQVDDADHVLALYNTAALAVVREGKVVILEPETMPIGQTVRMGADDKGRVWFMCVQRRRLVCFDGHEWSIEPPSVPSHPPILRVLDVDERGGLVGVSTDNKVVRYDGSSWRTYGSGSYIFEAVWVTDLACGPFPVLWLATSAGAVVFDGQEWRDCAEEGGPSTGLTCVAVDARWRPWFGAQGAVFVLDEGRWKTLELGAHDQTVSAIAIDKRGQVWLGTSNSGVKVYDEPCWRTYTTSDGLASNDVRAIVSDQKGRIWVGTNNGISMFARGKWRTFRQEDGLISNDARALVVDARGRVWVDSPAGLTVLTGHSWEKHGKASRG